VLLFLKTAIIQKKKDDEEDCDTYECSEKKFQDQNAGCQTKQRKCAQLGAVLGAAIGAGAAVGIALGAAALIALVATTGGVVAGATHYAAEDETEVNVNPTYIPSTQSSVGLGNF